MSIAIVGIGNLLMGDDGVGVRVLERLKQRYVLPPEVQLLDGGTKSIELLPYIEDARKVIFIDAVDFGRPPGFVAEVSGETVAEYFSNKLSVHQIGLPDLIGAMLLRGTVPEEMVLVGVQPSYTEIQWGLTEEVSKAVDEAAEKVVEKLRQWGLEVNDVSCNTL
jgi:hydrogenase maturation protease